MPDEAMGKLDALVRSGFTVSFAVVGEDPPLKTIGCIASKDLVNLHKFYGLSVQSSIQTAYDVLKMEGEL